MTLRLAILSSDDAHHRYLQARLGAEFDLRLVVVEPGNAQRRRLIERRRWADYAANTYHSWRRKLLGLDSYRRDYFRIPDGLPHMQCERLEVTSINAAAVAEALRRVEPEFVVVMGTSILRGAALEAISGRAVNIHGGYLPHYRGNHCFFWALYDGRYDRVGSTIHFIDAGIDTGDVIEVVPVDVEQDDTAETLYCRAERAAIERLIELLHAREAGATWPRHPQQAVGKAHRTRDRKPWHDVRLWMRRRFAA